MANVKRKSSQRQSNVHSQARRERIERNQISEFIINEKLVTTKAKAKEVQKKVEKLVTRAKVDSVHNRREVKKTLRKIESSKGEKCIDLLFKQGKKYENRKGGYTRLLKFGNRKGDNSQLTILIWT